MSPADGDQDPALAWARRVLDVPHLDDVDVLPGGSTSSVRALRAGSVRVVLKTLPADRGAEARDLVAGEARVLRALVGRGLPIPEVLAFDEDGRTAGQPALLMTRLPGAPPTGVDALRSAIPVMASALVQVQQRTRGLVAGRRWSPWWPPVLRAPSWSTHEMLWARVLRVIDRFDPPPPDSFVHRDPHPANLLLADGAVSGIVDWPHAGRGPAGVDVARFALNLACLLGQDAADDFRAAVLACGGPAADPLLDVFAAVEFLPDPVRAIAATSLEVPLGRDRILDRYETFVTDAMRRMTSRRIR